MVSGTAVTYVPHKELERYGPVNLSEALERLPALSTGGDRRGERILNLRGFEQRQVALYLDGVPIAIPYDGQLDLGRIPTALVDRVVIVNGASNLLYGPNGLGGAIDVVTRSPAQPFAALGIEAAPARAVRGTAAAGGSIGSLGAVAGVTGEVTRYSNLPSSFEPTYYEDGGRRNNSDRRSGNGWSKLVLDLGGDHELRWHGIRLQGRYGVPPATVDLAPSYWRWSDWQLSTVAVGHAYHGASVSIDEKVYVMTAANTLDAYDDGRYTAQATARAFHSVYDEGSVGAVVRAALRPRASAGEWGLRSWWGLRRDAHSGRADRVADTQSASTVQGTGALQAERNLFARQLQASVGLQADAEFPGHASSGPRPNAQSAFGPMGSVAWNGGSNSPLTLTLSAARRTRFPTLRERFSSAFGTRQPDPKLRPETALHSSLDAALRLKDRGRVSLGLFSAWLRDLITDRYVEPGVTQLQNIGSARHLGAELLGSIQPTELLEVSGGLLLLDARRTDDSEGTRRLAYRPRFKALLELRVAPVRRVSVGVTARAAGAQDYEDRLTGRWKALDPYVVFDGRIDWAVLDPLDVYLRSTNLANSLVVPHASFPDPGREVYVGLQAHFDGEP